MSELVLLNQLYLKHFDKLWGVVEQPVSVSNPSRSRSSKNKWVWWAHTGKSINIKRTYYYHSLETAKRNNGYKTITEEELLEKWPDIKQALTNRLLYEFLTSNE